MLPLIAAGTVLGLAGNMINAKIQQNRNKHEADIASDNYLQQQQLFEYQKHLNELTMEREDTAVQRRAQDLIAAGLDPSLAAGSAASSSTFSSAPAPQREITGKAHAFDVQQMMTMGTQFAQSVTDASTSWSNAEIAKAQAGVIEEKLANDLALQVAQTENVRGQTGKMAIEAAILNHDLDYLKRWNLPSNVHDHVKLATQIYDSTVANPQAKEAIDKLTHNAADVTSNVMNGVRTVVGNVEKSMDESRKKTIEKSNDLNERALRSPEESGLTQQEINAQRALMW